MVFAVAWYDEMQWHLLTRVVPDRSELDDTYQDWQTSAIKAIGMIEARGQVVERVPVDVGALRSWCQERNVPINGAARAEYAAQLLRNKRLGA